MRLAAAGVLIIFAASSCTASDAAVEPAESGPLTCQVEAAGVSYSTTLPTCDNASQDGRNAAVAAGLATEPDSLAADIAFGGTCSIIQGAEVKTYESPQYLELATVLSTTEVCPGDLSMLTPAP